MVSPEIDLTVPSWRAVAGVAAGAWANIRWLVVPESVSVKPRHSTVMRENAELRLSIDPGLLLWCDSAEQRNRGSRSERDPKKMRHLFDGATGSGANTFRYG